MRKKIIYIITLFCVKNALAYQISSNHSYLKNSNFTTDYDIDIKGYGDFKFIYNSTNNKPDNINTIKETKSTSTDIQTELSINISLKKQLDELSSIGISYVPVYNSLYREINKYYLYYNGYYGRFELGNVEGIFDIMRLGADNIALGSGGINSSFVRMAKLEDNYTYILSPNSLLSQNFGFYNNTVNWDYWNDTKYLSKASYISPELYGIQVGASIIQNVTLKQEYIGTLATLTNDINFGTFVNYGISYINTFDNVGIAISAVGEQNISNGLNKNSDIKEEIDYKFKSFEFGANINYFGWTIAGSFGKLSTNKEEISLKDPNNILLNFLQKEGSYTTYGFAYELGSIAMSATFFNSEYKDYTSFNSSSFAVEKKIHKGVSIYGEYSKYESEVKANKTSKQEGSTIFAGVLVNFE